MPSRHKTKGQAYNPAKDVTFATPERNTRTLGRNPHNLHQGTRPRVGSCEAPPTNTRTRPCEERDGESAVVVDKRALFHECDKEAIIVASPKNSKAEEQRGRNQNLEHVVKVQREPEVHERRKRRRHIANRQRPAITRGQKSGCAYDIRGVRFGGVSPRQRVAAPRWRRERTGRLQTWVRQKPPRKSQKKATELELTSNPLVRNQRTGKASAAETGDEEEGEPSHSLPAQGTKAPKSRTSIT